MAHHAKKVVIVTSGSRGDVQPYCALGLELAARGCDVVVCTEERVRPLVESFGLKYARLYGDPTAMLYDPAHQALLAEGRIMKVMAAAAKNQAPPEKVLGSVAEAAEGADVIVSAALTQPGTASVAEKLGVPWVPVFLGPVWPTREFCSWALSATPWRWKWANKASYKLLLSALWAQERAHVNAWRAKALSLAPLRGGVMPLVEGAGGAIPVVLMSGYEIVPGQRRPPDYPDFVQFTGYAYVPPAREADVEPSLRAFVAAGPPPVCLGFGSMPAPDPRKLLEMAAEVVRLTGRRAVLLAGWSDLKTGAGLPAELFVAREAPHDWLLPRCCCVVHHCGIGTCAAVLRAGVPSVPCPVMLDQPANALRLVEAGCAVKPLPFARLAAPALAARVEAACGDAVMAARAAEAAAGIARDWRGVAAAADAVLSAQSPWPKLRAAGVIS
ncbi:hypothetical protein Rsub_00353 [Raphidocelis subcapitata]|uniref:Uncharacterized protein n=1 Tax=Raphidocelis subcapitata TaxID=307507 RepID=A0A2V0NMK0_9CHLO|nr:hypothetical protein Rsub_00353 [Raphidocelis subcapitata]|eukprot:GBF87642.1 hypothetical protein Rsub_00353 [Raphidocelis subcapitata]